MDDGHPRNAPAARAHGYLTRDGAPPLELLSIGRLEVRAYGGAKLQGTVTSIRRLSQRGFRDETSDRMALHTRPRLVTPLLAAVPPHYPRPPARCRRRV